MKCLAHKDPILNLSDGVIVPNTLFSTLTDAQYQTVMKLSKTETLFVSISDTRTFFNVNMNILHRHHVTSGQEEENGKHSQGSIKNHNC